MWFRCPSIGWKVCTDQWRGLEGEWGGMVMFRWRVMQKVTAVFREGVENGDSRNLKETRVRAREAWYGWE